MFLAGWIHSTSLHPISFKYLPWGNPEADEIVVHLSYNTTYVAQPRGNISMDVTDGCFAVRMKQNAMVGGA